MPELDVLAVENYTLGRLNRDDDETVRLLAAALAVARRYCGWHVTPERQDTDVTLDGPGGHMLVLPTLRLKSIDALAENDSVIDVADLRVSARGLVRKKSGGFWSCEFGALVITMTHGFDEAPDFNAAVLSLIDRTSKVIAGGDEPTVIGPFQYPAATREEVGSVFSTAERCIFDLYALEPSP